MSEPLKPYGLTCEMLDRPLGLDERLPRLSWKLRSDRRGDAQSAYRITVALGETDLDAGRFIWDTGRRPSPDTVLVPYDGPPLQSSTRYHWRVTVWDGEAQQTGRADSWFETGLLHADDWRAVWIARDPASAPVMEPPRGDDRTDRTRHLQPCSHLRKPFALDGRRPVRARAYVTARGLYELRLNGHRVGDAELAPGWTEYEHRVQYQTYDVGHLLNEGEDVVGAVLADGWWSGYVGFDSRRQAMHYGDPHRLPATRRTARLARRRPGLPSHGLPQRRRGRVLRPLDARRSRRPASRWSVPRRRTRAVHDPRGRPGLGRRGSDHSLAAVPRVRGPARPRPVLSRDEGVGRPRPPAQPRAAVADGGRQPLRRLAAGRGRDPPRPAGHRLFRAQRRTRRRGRRCARPR